MNGVSLGRHPDFRTLMDHLDGVAIWTASTPEKFEYISAGFEDIWGIPAEAAENDVSLMIDGVHPDDRDEVVASMTRTGEELSADSFEHRVVCPDGTVRWVHARVVPIRDEHGGIAEVVGITTDITEQKRREQELEVLNRILRHDVRNDVNVITGWLTTLEGAVDGADADALARIQAASRHVVELTDLAREYVDVVVSEGEFDLEPVDLVATLETELAVRRRTYPDAEFRVVGDLPRVEVEANELLGSVFRNLLTNAVQHNDKPTPVVEVSAGVDGDTVRVSVADNGPGIPPAQRDRLFGEGERGLDSTGTGMGLYLCREIVAGYGGEVGVGDGDEAGAVFTVELKRSVA
ncbi:PAS domain-containing sensor histidine kinase [Salinigranum rubrum]|uniref:histidine kinase n=1 Tax=Salinigranum rubrum TaxID=755307 RepID=A0A2I8VKF3_9EURY|nr:PAS domain-containing sensor histidine kinase [Salinigranum rubrum]AUV82407.1 PAS domain-containing sensor histidine kinase [Salinigranum rubrum]